MAGNAKYNDTHDRSTANSQVDSIVQLTVAIAPRSQGQHGLRRWTRRTHAYSGSITCSSTSTLQCISTHLAMGARRTAAAGVWILGPVFHIAL